MVAFRIERDVPAGNAQSHLVVGSIEARGKRDAQASSGLTSAWAIRAAHPASVGLPSGAAMYPLR